jgi:hypothetical protein
MFYLAGCGGCGRIMMGNAERSSVTTIFNEDQRNGIQPLLSFLVEFHEVETLFSCSWI